jgi:WS/DGAT/MGAT family acyltransferase
MHVAATLIFEAGSLVGIDGALDIDRIRAYTASRLHLIPRYRQRLAYMPLDNHPIWIDDAHFNIDYHVRHTSLPRPGDESQLKELAARIMSQQLDRSKPLWELWAVEGLQGDRFALVAKTHHCLVDGLTAVDLLKVLLKGSAEMEIAEGPEFVPRVAPSRVRLVRDEVIHLASSPLDLLRTVGRGLADVGELGVEVAERARDLAEGLGVGPRVDAAVGALNREVGPHRRFDWVSMELDAVREVKSRLGGTVNDVVLATVAGAVRAFFEQRGEEVNAGGFRVLAPVSLQTEGTEKERGNPGNRISMWSIDLPVDEADPVLRLDRICDTTGELKESKQALGAKLLAQATDWTPTTLLSLSVQLLHRAPPFNLIVTNIPGPQLPLRLLGTRLLEAYPEVPLFGNQGLGVALFSYDGRLFWGFNADWDLLPDLSLFADAIVASFNALRAGAKMRSTRPARPRRAAGSKLQRPRAEASESGA